MPFQLNKKVFPIKLEAKQAAKIIQNALQKKGYKYEIKSDELYLTITPYWFCFYDILINKNDTFNRISSQIALNAINNQINERVIEFFSLAKPHFKEELEVSKTEKIKIILKNPIVAKEESEKTILKFLMYKHNVLEDQISLSGIEEIYVPNWKVKIDKYKIKIDAIKGTITDLNNIKQKEKTKLELVKEVFSDIKEEKKVIDYFKNIGNSILSVFSFIFKGVIKNYKIIFWIIIIALLFYLILL